VKDCSDLFVGSLLTFACDALAEPAARLVQRIAERGNTTARTD